MERDVRGGVRQRLLGMETLSRGLIRIVGDNVTILQSPTNLAEQIHASVKAIPDGP